MAALESVGMSKKISDRHQKSIEYALSEIKASSLFSYVEDVVLFGSTARGMARYESDVDLLLVLDESARSTIDNRDIRLLKVDVSPLDFELPDVDLKVTFNNNWMQSKDTIYLNIKEDGYSIWK